MQTSTIQAPPVLTVSQLTNAIKMSLETTFPAIGLQGEISNFTKHSSGHLYFNLKDANAVIAAVMFRGAASSLKMMPKNGDQVVVNGAVNVYPQGGRYQIVVSEMKMVGLGELLVKLEELKIKLHKMGWFKSERKKALPKFPKTIGVVTSPTGAAIQDILNILTRRFSGFHLILNPVKVQGEGAAQEIAQAIRQFNEYNLVDVMIVGRGGGSFEDLWAFNEEVVADAIYHSRIPIISAVGHETDHCIADYVADVRAPTPSAAAEIVIAEKAHQLGYLTQTQQRLLQHVQHKLKHARQRLTDIKRQPVFASPYALLGSRMQRLDDIRKHVQALKPTTKILHLKERLSHFDKALRAAMSQRLIGMRKALAEPAKRRQLDILFQRGMLLRKERLQQVGLALSSVSPKNLLTKGYSILFSEKGDSVIKSACDIEKHQNIRVLMSDGTLLTTVNEVIRK